MQDCVLGINVLGWKQNAVAMTGNRHNGTIRMVAMEGEKRN
jgi:hypothetical protein